MNEISTDEQNIITMCYNIAIDSASDEELKTLLTDNGMFQQILKDREKAIKYDLLFDQLQMLMKGYTWLESNKIEDIPRLVDRIHELNMKVRELIERPK